MTALPPEDYSNLPHVFPIENVHSWFFYNLNNTRLPYWYTQEYEHEAILQRIAQILHRQGRFNEYVRRSINHLWEEHDSLKAYVLALEIRLDLKDAELESMIEQLREDMEDADTQLQHNIDLNNARDDAQDVRLDQHEDRIEILEEYDIKEKAFVDFLEQGDPGQIIVKDPAADNFAHVDWKDPESGLDLEADSESTNSAPSVDLDKTVNPAELTVDFGVGGLIPPVDLGETGTKVLSGRVESGEPVLEWQDKDSVEIELDVVATRGNRIATTSFDDSITPAKLTTDFGVTGMVPPVPTIADQEYSLKADVMAGAPSFSWVDVGETGGGGEIIKPVNGISTTIDNYLLPIPRNSSISGGPNITHIVDVGTGGSEFPTTGSADTLYVATSTSGSSRNSSWIWVPGVDIAGSVTAGHVGGSYVQVRMNGVFSPNYGSTSNMYGHPYWDGTVSNAHSNYGMIPVNAGKRVITLMQKAETHVNISGPQNVAGEDIRFYHTSRPIGGMSSGYKVFSIELVKCGVQWDNGGTWQNAAWLPQNLEAFAISGDTSPDLLYPAGVIPRSFLDKAGLQPLGSSGPLVRDSIPDGVALRLQPVWKILVTID